MASPTDLLSKELLVATEIHRMEEEGTLVHFNSLVDSLADQNLVKSRTTVRQALNILFDQGMAKAEWTIRKSDGKHVRRIAIPGEAKKFIAGIYNRTRV